MTHAPSTPPTPPQRSANELVREMLERNAKRRAIVMAKIANMRRYADELRARSR